ncbi:hypothetical protein AB0G54_24495 [Streptomyces yokosukanensis]|uniref:AtuA-related protein n=1 Tax=Streptomyces yokosukanensis TaxID=67386 RepID=UPI000A717F1A|nr:hypothetical protein [Streptomyces yokosukanensis]
MHPASAPGPTLRDLAHARAGDKGRGLTLTIVARNAADHPMLRARLTAALALPVPTEAPIEIPNEPTTPARRWESP